MALLPSQLLSVAGRTSSTLEAPTPPGAAAAGAIDPAHKQDVVDALRAMGVEPTEEEVQAVIKRLEQDKYVWRVGKSESTPSLRRSTFRPSSARFAPPPSDEREEFRQIFCLFKLLCSSPGGGMGQDRSLDWDPTGSISVEELENLLEIVGMRLDTGELEVMVRSMDLDGNGVIDFQEFCDRMSSSIQVSYTPEEISESFKVFAKKAPHGHIKVADLRSALQTFMHKDLIDSEINALLLHFKDSIGCLYGSDEEFFNYQEYIEIMTPLVSTASSNDADRGGSPHHSRKRAMSIASSARSSRKG